MSKRRVTDFFKPKVQSVSVEKIDEPPKKTPNLTVIPQEQETAMRINHLVQQKSTFFRNQVLAKEIVHASITGSKIIRGCITMKGKYNLLCSVKNQR